MYVLTDMLLSKQLGVACSQVRGRPSRQVATVAHYGFASASEQNPALDERAIA